MVDMKKTLEIHVDIYFTCTNYIMTQCNDNIIRNDLLFYYYYFFIQEQVGQTPESNSILKCILSPKIFQVQKSVGSKKVLIPKNCWVQKNVSSDQS